VCRPDEGTNRRDHSITYLKTAGSGVVDRGPVILYGVSTISSNLCNLSYLPTGQNGSSPAIQVAAIPSSQALFHVSSHTQWIWQPQQNIPAPECERASISFSVASTMTVLSRWLSWTYGSRFKLRSIWPNCLALFSPSFKEGSFTSADKEPSMRAVASSVSDKFRAYV
jgi:hypothetical protein